MKKKTRLDHLNERFETLYEEMSELEDGSEEKKAKMEELKEIQAMISKEVTMANETAAVENTDELERSKNKSDIALRIGGLALTGLMFGVKIFTDNKFWREGMEYEKHDGFRYKTFGEKRKDFLKFDIFKGMKR